MHIPIDNSIKNIVDIPYTISFVIRKRQQIDSFSELPEEKRPPDDIIWDGTTEDIDQWLDRVLKSKSNDDGKIIITDIEG